MSSEKKPAKHSEKPLLLWVILLIILFGCGLFLTSFTPFYTKKAVPADQSPRGPRYFTIV